MFLRPSFSRGEGFPKPVTRKPTNNANDIQEAIKVIAHYNDAARWGRSPITFLGFTMTLKTVSDAAATVESPSVSTLPVKAPAFSVQLLTMSPR